MKRLFLSIILCTSTWIAFAQNPKVMDLSGGGFRIDGFKIEKIDNAFIIIPKGDSVGISQIIIKAGVKSPLIVKRKATHNDTVFTEVTTNKTNIRLSKEQKDTLQLFSFHVGNDYIVEHNDKRWDIRVRKDGSLDVLANASNGGAIFINAKKMLCIGDSTVSTTGGDTLHYILTDSFVVSDIDRFLSLKYEGKEIKDKLVTSTDDKIYYSIKKIVSADSVFHAGDTLTVEKNGKVVGIIVFESKGNSQFSMWLLILIVFVPVVTFAWIWFIRNRKKHGDNNDAKANNKDDGEKKNGDINSSQMTVSEFYSQLNDMIESLLNIMPKKVNGVSKNNFFSKREDLEDILNNIILVKATNRPSLIKKCTDILAFIEANKSVLSQNQPLSTKSTDATGTTENHEGNYGIKVESTGDNKETSAVNSNENSAEHLAVYPEEISKGNVTDIPRVQGSNSADSTMGTELFALNKKYESLQSKYNKLAEDYKELLDVYANDIEDAKAETRRQVEAEMQKYVESAQKQAEEADKKRKEAEDTKKADIEAAVKKEKDVQEKEKKRLREDKLKADERAEAAERSKKKAVKDAVEKAKVDHEKEEKRLNDVIEKQKDELTRMDNFLKFIQNELKETKEDRDKKKLKIEHLEKAQEEFTRSLTSVPFATAYCKQVYDLLNLGRKIQTSAYTVLDMDVDDPYFIMKAISRFGKMMDNIDVSRFLTDVYMVAKAKFIFKDSSLATFKAENKDIDNIVRNYFFNQYLGKYVNALMVLNESMVGLKLLLPELKSQADKFEKFRTELLALSKTLNITVLYVKVGDMAGENVDLKAKSVDVEIGKPGQILEMENCIVYMTDSRKPQTKIKVTIKK